MRLRSLSIALVLSGFITATAGAQAVRQGDQVPTGKGGWGLPAVDVPPISLQKRKPKPPPPPPPGNNGINYHNGPVMLGTVNMYYIWYGDWSGNSAVDILTDL